jgi:hypothetical protein
MKRSVWIMVSLVLAAIVALSFLRPHQMVSPGNLIPAHTALESDCFACHAPLQGASDGRCTNCHALADIGLKTTKGAAIRPSARHPAFHQALTEPDCMACHSDHPRPSLTRARMISFDHALLKADTQAQCQSCHTAPRDELHGGQAMACATCHQPPRWKPATFDHDRYFRLDGDHRTTCATCHPAAGNYKRYTCYGCHEHQPAGILALHRKEGIRTIANCANCHRSASGEAGEGEGEGRGGDDD